MVGDLLGEDLILGAMLDDIEKMVQKADGKCLRCLL